MKKQRRSVPPILLSLVLFTNCTYLGDTSKETTPEPIPEITNSFAERLVGTYRTTSEENGETILQIYQIQECLIAEVEEEYAAYYAMEWVPDPLRITGNDTESKDFTVYTFSGFSNAGAYWDSTNQIMVTLEENVLKIEEEGGNTTSYIRDEGIEPIHDPRRYTEFFENVSDHALIGQWSTVSAEGYELYLRIDSDRTMLWSCRKAGQPVEVYIGGISAEQESGKIQIIAERVGWAQMPWLFELQYTIGADGNLILENAGAEELLPFKHEIQLKKATEQE